MRYILLAMCLFTTLYALEPSFMHSPAISPDGSKVCFGWNGDLFEVPWQGGSATRLTSSPGDETEPSYSPDGKLIAFNGQKDAYRAIYMIASGGGMAQEIPCRNVYLEGWFPDGKHLLAKQYWNSDRPAYVKVSIADGSMQQIGGYAGDYSSVSPDGKQIIFSRYGYPYREKYTGSQNGELWLYNIAADTYTKLTDTDFTEHYPVFSPTHKDQVYYSAPVEGVFQIFRASLKKMSKPRQITTLQDFSARHLSISTSQERIVFVFFDKLWTWDEASGKSRELNIRIDEDVFGSTVLYNSWQNNADEFAPSPNFSWMLFKKSNDLFAVPTAGGEVIQITTDQPWITDYSILPDNKTFVYATQDKAGSSLYRGDISQPENVNPISWDQTRQIEHIGISDSTIAIQYSRRNEPKRVICYDDSLNQVVFTLDNAEVFTWQLSPNKKWLAYVTRNFEENSRLFIMDVATKQSRFIESYLWNWNMNLMWSPKGDMLFAVDNGRIVRYDIKPLQEYVFEKDNWKDILHPVTAAKKDTTAVKPPAPEDKIVWDNIDGRGIVIVGGDDWISFSHMEDDNILYMVSKDGVNQLYTVDFEGKKVDKKGKLEVADVLYDAAGKRFYYQRGGNVIHCDASGGDAKTCEFKYQHTFDSKVLNHRVFDQVWCTYANQFYDPNMHGLDWQATYDKYHSYLDKVTDGQSLAAIVDEMIGDLNASHSEYDARSEGGIAFRNAAFLGCELDLADRIAVGIRIAKTYRLSALTQVYGVKTGDVILSIDDNQIYPQTDVRSLLQDKEDRKIRLSVLSGADTLKCIIRGLNYGKLDKLRYDNWVFQRRQLVDELSGGKLGYIHIRSMDWDCLRQFYKELSDIRIDKKGLIIDVRNNGGGYIASSLIDELKSQPDHYINAYDRPAGLHGEPSDLAKLPKVVLINEHSYSNAEIFPLIFRTHKLGQVIGVATSGYVIAVKTIGLMDGSSIRVPFIGHYTIEDKMNMEGNGAKPDIVVEPTIEQIIADDDIQLKRAIQELGGAK